MNILNKYKLSALASVLCLSVVFSTPVLAAEDPAVASEMRYHMEIQSDSWENWPAGPQIYAESAIVMEASTGTILYAKSIDEQYYPASITKIMTVLLALEHLDMDEEVTFSHTAVYTVEPGSSSIYRDEGEVLTVEECLYAIMLESANECANAIAEQVSGSVEAFCDLMNERARELGCANTHFVNPHGLPDDNHYTTAHDMALITQEAIKHEKFRQISGTSRYILRATNKKDEELPMSNHHYMLSANRTSRFLDDTVFAGKTGYTTVALNTLVTCATRNGMDLIVVTMKTQGSAERGVPLFSDTASLLDYAGENFHKVNIAENETTFTIGQNGLFDTGSSVFGDSAPMIEIDPSGYIVLPVDVDFTAASPRLEFNDNNGSSSIATLHYTYADQNIGSTDLLFSANDIQDFDFQMAENKEQPDDSESVPAGQSPTKKEKETNLIRVNIRIVAIAAGALVGLLAGILLVRKFTFNFTHKDDWKL